MKKNKLVFLFTLLVLSLSTITANEKGLINEKNNKINFSALEFNEQGDLEMIYYAQATCKEVRDGVTYSTTVGCFLCGEERAKDRCEKILSRKIDRLDPDRN